MKILLTGATGTLGSQVLFSLLEEKFSSIERIYLPVREKKSTSSEKRIFNMLQSDFAPKFIKNNLTEIRAKITTVSAKDILNPERFLFGAKITHFIHSAGFVNLSTLPEAKAEIFKENFDFTKSIFEAYSKLIDKFIYISTAFSVGNSGGLIPNDYLKTEPTAHRNHYEASKYASEKYLTQAGAVAGIPIQILRPSVLGGNIKDAPNYFISKYMVFYLFAKFFYNNASKDAIRISTNIATGLNINFFSLFSELNPHIYFGGDNVVFWGPLAWTVIYGLIIATFLTLIVVPILFFLSMKFKMRVKGLLKTPEAITE